MVAEAVSAGFSLGFAAASTLQSFGSLPSLSGLHRSLPFLAAGAAGFTAFFAVVEATFVVAFSGFFLASATVVFFFDVEATFFFTIFFLASFESSSRLKMLADFDFFAKELGERNLPRFHPFATACRTRKIHRLRLRQSGQAGGALASIQNVRRLRFFRQPAKAGQRQTRFHPNRRHRCGTPPYHPTWAMR